MALALNPVHARDGSLDADAVQFDFDQISQQFPSLAQLHSPGDVKLSARSSPESGWLTCDGSAVSRTGYTNLFTAIGTAWGNGDGSTTFNLPDLRGRGPIGAGTGSGLTGRALAATGGEENHTLTVAETASHNHGASTGGVGDHSHGVQRTNVAASGQGTDTSSVYKPQAGTGTSFFATDNAGAHSHSISSQGGGGAHNNMHPYAVVNFFIKT